MILKNDLLKIMKSLNIDFWGAIVFTDEVVEKITLRELQLESKIESLECAPPNDLRWLCLNRQKKDIPTLIISIAIPYNTWGRESSFNLGVIDAFAWGMDYHEIVKAHLKNVHKLLSIESNEPEFCVDTSNYIDREIGLYSGLGKYGKNHMLINPIIGSRFFIGYLVYRKPLLIETFDCNTSEIIYGECSECRVCEKACPSKICGTKKGSPSNCIGMLTQSKKNLSEREMTLIAGQMYGCNICQKVCPANSGSIDSYNPIGDGEGCVDLKTLLLMNNKAFKEQYGNMAFAWRNLWIYKRNAMINMGNKGNSEDLFWLKNFTPPERIEYAYDWAIAKLEKLNLRNSYHP